MKTAIILTTTAAIGSAVATIWLATVTRKLAIGTESLVKTTKSQGEQSAEANHLRDKLLRDTFLVENRRKIYRDLMYYLVVWRQHFETIGEYAQTSLNKEGTFSIATLGVVQNLSGKWPLKEGFDAVRMTVELDLDDDHEIATLYSKWEEAVEGIQNYLDVLINSIRKGVSTIDTTVTPVVRGNPFSQIGDENPNSIGLIPSDRNVMYVLSSVSESLPRLRELEGQIESIMKHKLDVT